MALAFDTRMKMYNLTLEQKLIEDKTRILLNREIKLQKKKSICYKNWNYNSGIEALAD